ncbi:MAG: (d)CMP kinase [Opitutaceae bacterium]|nr:(d)CMP kinase [Cytophagales bacterium]
MRKIIIAIDGYSGCGKSTTAKKVAAKLNYLYIDTGAMYRATTLYFLESFISLSNPKEIDKALSNIHLNFIFNSVTGNNDIFLNNLNVEEEIRKMYVSEKVSQVSTLPQVRKTLVDQQRRMAKKGAVVMDGRDIGTNVFPNAELKVFVTADINIRAARRQQELFEKGEEFTLPYIIANLNERDRIDTTRTENPLRKAEDAYILDTSYITINEQVDYVVNLYLGKVIP